MEERWEKKKGEGSIRKFWEIVYTNARSIYIFLFSYIRNGEPRGVTPVIPIPLDPTVYIHVYILLVQHNILFNVKSYGKTILNNMIFLVSTVFIVDFITPPPILLPTRVINGVFDNNSSLTLT